MVKKTKKTKTFVKSVSCSLSDSPDKTHLVLKQWRVNSLAHTPHVTYLRVCKLCDKCGMRKS